MTGMVLERLHNLGGGWYVVAHEGGDVELQLRHEPTGAVLHRKRLDAVAWATALSEVAEERQGGRADLLRQFLILHRGRPPDGTEEPPSSPAARPGDPAAYEAPMLPTFACWPLAEYVAADGLRYKPEISSAFGETRHKGGKRAQHPGADICYRMRRLGERPELAEDQDRRHWISASGRYFLPPGTMTRAVLPARVWSVERMGTGWFVVLDHGELAPLCTAYAHILERPPVSRGDALDAGDVIGVVGWSPKGNPFAHTHLEAWDFSRGHRVKVDPAPLLKGAEVL